MAAVPVPPNLHEDLLKQAFARRGAEMRRKLYQAAALAAAILFAVAVGTGVLWANRPLLNPEELAIRSEIEQEQKEQAVRLWLDEQGLPANWPYQFNFQLCVFYGKENLAGRDVPVVVFAQAGKIAKVYLVKRSRFKTEYARFAKSSLCTVEVSHDVHPDVVFVISYTSDNLGLFLLRQPSNITV